MFAKSALLAFVLVIVGTWLYQPMPEDIYSPNLIRIMNLCVKAIDKVAGVGEMLGLGVGLNITRSINKRFYAVMPTPEKMQIVSSTFEGIPVRIYKYEEKDGGQDSAVIYFHGGGWVLGDLDFNDIFCKKVGERSRFVIVSVDYRLAPEHPFPLGLEDCVKATLYFFRFAKKYGVNPEKIALMGDSAGGNLAAAVILKMLSLGHLPMPAAQVLLYPLLQLLDLNLPSHIQKDGVTLLSLEKIAYFALSYLNKSLSYAPILLKNQLVTKKDFALYADDLDVWALPEEYRSTALGSFQSKNKHQFISEDIPRTNDLDELAELVLNPLMSPLIAKDLSQHPRAFILTVGQDPLMDDGILYVNKLKKSGVEVEWDHYQSSIHSVFSLDFDPNVEIAISKIVRFLSEM